MSYVSYLIRNGIYLRVAKAAVRSKVVVLLLLIYSMMYFPLFVGVLCLSLICYACFMSILVLQLS